MLKCQNCVKIKIEMGVCKTGFVAISPSASPPKRKKKKKTVIFSRPKGWVASYLFGHFTVLCRRPSWHCLVLHYTKKSTLGSVIVSYWGEIVQLPLCSWRHLTFTIRHFKLINLPHNVKRNVYSLTVNVFIRSEILWPLLMRPLRDLPAIHETPTTHTTVASKTTWKYRRG